MSVAAAASESSVPEELPEPGTELLTNEVEISAAGEAVSVAAATPEATGSIELVPDPSTDAVPSSAEPEAPRRTLQEFGIENYVAPVYPRTAHRRGITGMVDVMFKINVDGSIDSLEVAHAEPGDVFAESALDAVRQWRFAPRADVIQGRITLRFDLVE